MKEEALKLADELEDEAKYGECDWTSPRVSATMIRRLVEELDKQNPSVFTILTCGCKSEFMGFPSEWDGETRECEPCVNYGSLCEQHFMEYEARPAQYTPQTKPFNEEEFNAIAYSYRSWPAHDPKGVSNRYQELLNYLERHGIK